MLGGTNIAEPGTSGGDGRVRGLNRATRRSATGLSAAMDGTRRRRRRRETHGPEHSGGRRTDIRIRLSGVRIVRALWFRPSMPTIDQIIVWMVIGLLGGSLAGLITTRKWQGHGFFRNLGVGLVGALVGGLLFRMLGLFPRLDAFAISLRDVVAAFVGSLLVLLGLWIWQRSRRFR